MRAHHLAHSNCAKKRCVNLSKYGGAFLKKSTYKIGEVFFYKNVLKIGKKIRELKI